MKVAARVWILALCLGLALGEPARAEQSIARQWNDILLQAIRDDFARPTVHARNLFHLSIAMWDAWAAYDDAFPPYLHPDAGASADVPSARAESISFAAYRLIHARFENSPGAVSTKAAADAKMVELGYDASFVQTDGPSAAALGNRVAEAVLAFGLSDGSNEANDYESPLYAPANPPLLPDFPGNPNLVEPNRWQGVALQFFIDQSGIPIPFGSLDFLTPHWGQVTPFALDSDLATLRERDGASYPVHLDVGAPPLFGGAGHETWLSSFEEVLALSALLDPLDGTLIDVSPGARGNSALGANDGAGHEVNPVTQQPYAQRMVPAGDYFRVQAEFWADGPDSETPPGHWVLIHNEVVEAAAFERRLGGEGPELDPLHWDVQAYLVLTGALHDAAIAAWSHKGWYDFVRPISAIRYLGDLGQRSDPSQPSYHPDGLALEEGRVEIVTAETTAPGARHEHLAGEQGGNLGKLAVRAWRGPSFIVDPETDVAGVGWILVEDWWPYQRPTFVTPPFAGYVSGHSTYSRAAAEVLTRLTGTPYFPGGMVEFLAPRNEFLVFEEGPSVDVPLQWATYYDAADECARSRIYGGIHPGIDDIPGRLIGAQIGAMAYARAQEFFGPRSTVSIAKGVARRRAVVLAGSVSTGGEGAADVLEFDEGLSLEVRDGLALEHHVSFGAADCSEKRTGKVVCRSTDRQSKAVFKPDRGAPQNWNFQVRFKGAGFGEDFTGPLSLDVVSGSIWRRGSIDDCAASRGKLVCRE